jgi:hypothetical protein
MVVAVTVLAIALRVAWVLLVPSKPVGDFAMYVEAAAHLVEHGRFGPEYVYMPGYVLLIAPVQALGGGWLATKLVGAVLGGLGAGAVAGIARHIAGGSRRVALVAGLLCALWPAGIAMASVTGTDVPAAVLAVAATYFLLRFAPARPVLAALLSGGLFGLAAYIRAIMVPLAALSVLVFRAAGKPWRPSLKLAALACATALFVLSPWAVRNRLRYGETFFTDSHGGLTALVGANPNTAGCYSRSLNRMFHEVTGFSLLAEPHRQADRAALGIALAWTRFDPLFSLGLYASKAERLLFRERALLYWPIFRAGVLPDGDRAFFDAHRATIEAVLDDFWLGVLALALLGGGVAYAQRRWLLLSLLPPVAALAALTAAIFAEARYRLFVAMLLLPLAAFALDWAYTTGRGLWRRAAPAAWKREAVIGLGLVALLGAALPALAWAGERLRQGRRWAVHPCRIVGEPRFCAWRTVGDATVVGREPVLQGVWNGVGIALPALGTQAAARVSAETEIEVPEGDYDLAADVDLTLSHSAGPADGSFVVLADGRPVAAPFPLAQVPAAGRGQPPLPWRARFRHTGGTLCLRLHIENGATPAPPGRLWLGNLRLRPGS